MLYRFVKTLLLSLTAGLTLLTTVPVYSQQNITVKGSDTMVLIAQRWAEISMKKNKGVAIQVTGGGSGTGIAALINGTTNIANSSRPIKGSEKKQALQSGVDPVEFKVALDGLSVVVNKANPVNELTLRDVMGIYIGAINNWNQVGGPDAPIIRYSRESNSGTYVFFKEHVLQNKDFAPDCQNMPGTSALANAVSKDVNGIGYGGVAYFMTQPDCKILKIKKDKDTPAVSPVAPDGKTINFNAIYDESYPIARYLYMYTNGQPKGAIKDYLNWILGEEGQRVAMDVGYIPVTRLKGM
jgi:phosphate transport system substrate-binding protein